MSRVEFYRKSVGWSQAALAKASACSQPTISSIENGGGTEIAVARRIAVALANKGAKNEIGESVSLDDVFPESSTKTEAA